MNRFIHLNKATPPFIATIVFACFTLSPQAQATCQEGCLTNSNTVLGEDALFSLTIGSGNTAIGFEALFRNTTGFFNTATGLFSLVNNTTGVDNTANGAQALSVNTTGSANTAIGSSSLFLNTTGNNNTATGFQALVSNTTGSENTASGFNALLNNTTGVNNTAAGSQALDSNTTGGNNTATGSNALSSNTTGNSNIALGVNAGINLTTGNNNIDVGNSGVGGESNTIRIGTRGNHTATFIAGIFGVAVNGSQVVVNSNGKLGATASSKRFKNQIQPMDKASEAILTLQPVTFRYKKELDPDGIPQFGLVAEQVEKVNPDLVARDDHGKPYTVRYEAVNAMLLNEFLKEHRIVQDLKSTVAKQEASISQQKEDFQAIATQQQKEIQALTASLKEQAAQIQKVSAQLEASKSAPQMVNNP